MADNKCYLIESEAAEYLRFQPSTLATWRRKQKGPRYFKKGETIIYDLEDIQVFLDSKRFTPSKK